MPSRRSAPAPATDDDKDRYNEQLNDILDPKSAIAKADNVHRAVANPYYWSLLSDEDRSEILKLWPDQKAVINAGTPKAVLDFDCIKVNRDLRVNCRQYSEDHAAGRHEPEWLASAERAHVNRGEGLYDEMRADHVERQFGVPVMRKESKGKGRADSKSPEEEKEHQPQQQNGGGEISASAVGQQEGSAPEIVATQHADKDGQDVTEEHSGSKKVEDKTIVQPKADEHEATEQQGSTTQQEPIVQQEVAVHEDVTAENATVEPEQAAAIVEVTNTESDNGKKAEDDSPETSPSTRSGVLRRSKRQTSRSNPISRASSS
ncbi:hypothetical protein PG993_010326 [Apiospora rasikravindrae]|uniref:ASX DEUBAD domain-containing protein n=1 Tax=Apiospora rasikravindrae TaxID=990691 RepID=A0ABR1SN75_9PEZI